MVAWNYDPNQYDSNKAIGGELIPAGEHKVRINTVTPKTSKTGYQMLEIKLDVAGFPRTSLYYNLVFMPDKPEITNQNLGGLFDSFGIQPGNMNYPSWVGTMGAAHVKHDEYNGKARAQVHYFHTRAKQAELGLLSGAGMPQAPIPSIPASAPTGQQPYPASW